jgi:hypothetical protein
MAILQCNVIRDDALRAATDPEAAGAQRRHHTPKGRASEEAPRWRVSAVCLEWPTAVF